MNHGMNEQLADMENCRVFLKMLPLPYGYLKLEMPQQRLAKKPISTWDAARRVTSSWDQFGMDKNKKVNGEI